jgi:hypothetical protein
MLNLQGFHGTRRWLTLFCGCWLAFTGNPFAASPSAEAQTKAHSGFSREIRPILSQHCTQCHGPDEETRQADLRLDTEAGLRSLAGEELDYAAFLERIQSDDPDYRMPPPEANKDLTPDQIKRLEEWIGEGATWTQHWSFIPPREPEVSVVKADSWVRTPVDRFVVSRLQAANLEPSRDAAPIQLVRRLFLDLIGMPPTPEEADQWVERIWSRDDLGETQVDEAAYQSLVTRLLGSPHYGERWARRWLDLARYADTNGYEKDRERSIWPYRDWVVQAINDDMPFDQFTVEQLAGDMLPDATRDQRIATGFHRNTMLNEEGGIDPLEFRYYAVVDRVATTGTTWLGLTLGCCQCHTHKYDPISHAEYFEIFALFNNADEPHLELPDDGLEQRWEENRKRAEALIAKLPDSWPVPSTEQPAADEAGGQRDGRGADQELPTETPTESKIGSQSLESSRAQLVEAAFDAWLEMERQHSAKWVIAEPIKATSNLPILTIEEDSAIFASGDTAKRDDYWIELAPSDEPITAILLEALPDERLPERGPGSTYYEGTRGDFFLNEIEFECDDKPLAVASATESFAKNRFGSNPVSAALALDGDVQTGWSVHGRQGERHVAVFNLQEPIPAGTRVGVHMVFGRHFASSLGRFRFRFAATENQPRANEYTDEVLDLLARETDDYEPEELSLLRRSFYLQADELEAPVQEIRKLLKRPEAVTSLVLEERSPQHPRQTFRHHRGEYLQAEEQVSSGVPDVVNLRTSSPQNRLEFAYWLVDGSNPLTARVVVNRAWAAFFGTGIVATVDDFGLQGEYPSHPELLDWLALRFMREDQWSLKKLHRRIVSSSTYRQASAYRQDSSEVDPTNRLLSYFPRERLEAEIIRDSLLFASGKLNDAMGGPPVRPPQPAGVTEDTFGAPKWRASSGGDRYRRSLYTFQKRTAPFAMFGTFDAPSGEACIARRTVSNSPLQALTLLNDAMFLELARALAKDVQSERPEHTTRLKRLFRRVLVRAPTREELHKLEAFYLQQVERIAESPDAVAKLLGQPARKPPVMEGANSEAEPGGNVKEGDDSGGEANVQLASERDSELNLASRTSKNDVQLAALTLVARAVFGLDETINRE